MIVEIDKFLNAVDLEKAGNTDKSIPLSNSNSFTESLGIGKAKLPKINPISFNPLWDLSSVCKCSQ